MSTLLTRTMWVSKNYRLEFNEEGIIGKTRRVGEP